MQAYAGFLAQTPVRFRERDEPASPELEERSETWDAGEKTEVHGRYKSSMISNLSSVIAMGRGKIESALKERFKSFGANEGHFRALNIAQDKAHRRSPQLLLARNAEKTPVRPTPLNSKKTQSELKEQILNKFTLDNNAEIFLNLGTRPEFQSHRREKKMGIQVFKEWRSQSIEKSFAFDSKRRGRPAAQISPHTDARESAMSDL